MIRTDLDNLVIRYCLFYTPVSLSLFINEFRHILCVIVMMNMDNDFTREKLIDIQEIIKNNKLYKQELNFKIIVIGDFGVGKTSIIRRYTEGEFSTAYKITIGADFAIKILEWDEETRINLHVWDIAGHERFGSLLSVFYRHAVAAAIVFDLTRPETFKSVDKWLTDLRRKIQSPDGQSIPVVILANKGDIKVKTLPPEHSSLVHNIRKKQYEYCCGNIQFYVLGDGKSTSTIYFKKGKLA